MINWKVFEADFLKGIPKIKEKLDGVLMLNLRGTLGVRIHNKGQATDGSQIGYYDDEYKKVREGKGQETGYVNLQDTGELAKSLIVGEEKGQKVLGFEEIMYENGFDTIENTEVQEDNFGKEIFSPSEKEIDKAYSGAERSISKDLDKLINSALDKAIKNDSTNNS